MVRPEQRILGVRLALLALPPLRKMSLEMAFRDLFAQHGLNYEFSKKYTVKNDLTVIFSIERNAYCYVSATVAPIWKTDEEHDDMFYDAIEDALKTWLKERLTAPPA